MLRTGRPPLRQNRKLAAADTLEAAAYSEQRQNHRLFHMLRHLFLIGYDIASPRRLRRALKVVKSHAIGGQKSLYECWMTSAELQQAMHQLRQLIDVQADRVVFVRLDPRARMHMRGTAVAPADGEFFYQG